MSISTVLGGRSWAACATADPDLFFPEFDTPAERIEEAKAYCGACPIKEACLQDAMRRNDTDAICGGLTARERQQLLRPFGVTREGKPMTRRPARATARQLSVKHGANLMMSLVEWRMSLEQVAASLGSTPMAVYRAYLMLVPVRPGQQRSVRPNVIEDLLRTSKEQLRTLERRGLSHSEIGIVLRVDQSVVSASLAVLRQREEGIRLLSRNGQDGLQRLRDDEVRLRLESGVALSPQDVVEAFGQSLLRMHGEGVPLRRIARELGLGRETVRQAFLELTSKTVTTALKRQDMEEAA